jgi:fructose-1,6-bisphosphatase/sedoheptulose 1,7-bisphosphatase-like protein
MKRYSVEIDEPLAEELEAVARDVAKLKPEDLVVLLVAKALAPWHRVVKENERLTNE